MSQRNLAHGSEGWVLSLMCGRRIEIQGFGTSVYNRIMAEDVICASDAIRHSSMECHRL